MTNIRNIPSSSKLGARLRVLRGDRSQAECAKALGVSQSLLAKWEAGSRAITQSAMLKISEISSENERDYWLRLAGVDPPALEQSLKGYKQTSSYVEGDMLIVPIRSGAIAAGQPLSMDIEEYEGRIGIPLAEAAETGCFIAARVKGNSMAPRIMEGYLVVIDSRRRPPKDNVGQIVAAADEQGDMTIKILGQNRGGFFLVAGNPDFEPHIQNIDVSNKWAIFGRVVKWIGQLDRKRK